jgi:hypothetical protein
VLYKHLVSLGALLRIGPHTSGNINRVMSVKNNELAGVDFVVSGDVE